MDADTVKEMLNTAGKLIQDRGSVDDTWLLPKHITDSFRSMARFFPVRVGDTGVFTTCAVPKGSVVTLHPCHAIRLTNPSTGDDMVYSSRHLGKEELTRMKTCGRFLTRHDGMRAEVLGDPRHKFEAHSCGHKIRDPHPALGSLCVRPKTPAEMWRAALQYEMAVAGAANCRFQPYAGTAVMCVATRDIAEGAEVLAPHGYEHFCKLPFEQMTKWAAEHLDDDQKSGKLEVARRIISM
jgi:hypothetical protein